MLVPDQDSQSGWRLGTRCRWAAGEACQVAAGGERLVHEPFVEAAYMRLAGAGEAANPRASQCIAVAWAAAVAVHTWAVAVADGIVRHWGLGGR